MGDLCTIVVLRGEKEFGTLLAELFEDGVLAFSWVNSDVVYDSSGSDSFRDSMTSNSSSRVSLIRFTLYKRELGFHFGSHHHFADVVKVRKVFVVVASAFEHVAHNVDRDVRPCGECERVARSGIDDGVSTGSNEVQVGDVGSIVDGTDDDSIDTTAEFFDAIEQEIVCERSTDIGGVESSHNARCLGESDKDRQEVVLVFDRQCDDRDGSFGRASDPNSLDRRVHTTTMGARRKTSPGCTVHCLGLHHL